MSLKSASTDILMQLAEVIGQLTDHDYARPLAVLSGNTIGKHVRHILEFYELLVTSVQTGQLNYDRRHRDLLLEVDTDEALRRIGTIDRAIHRIDLNQSIGLEADLSVKGTENLQIPSSFARELLYNIEHAIHHMALVQIAVQNAFPAVELPEHFGVAYSTVKHQSH
ncbi:DinB family protein [Spirosoma endbachense]|uniref:DinB family protein n=1 Tax=Spirosoma endbachense TaxID=2666025 RepID=A0A6P1W2Z7_9BACT|nr:DinB family protein [Spirosoma endbachense]QHV99793.1 DinB family protein [Spirosoma endbachense]